MRPLTSERAYFDWNATAPLQPAARAAMLAALDAVGNASSVHGEGRAARGRLEAARRQVAALVGAQPAEVVFVSGATEANALALQADITVDGIKVPRGRLFMSAVEHPSSLPAGGSRRVKASSCRWMATASSMSLRSLRRWPRPSGRWSRSCSPITRLA